MSAATETNKTDQGDTATKAEGDSVDAAKVWLEEKDKLTKDLKNMKVNIETI